MIVSELKSALALYAQRTVPDDWFASLLPVAEARIYNGEADTQSLRISSMLKTSSALTLPADWLAMQRLDTGFEALEFVPYQSFADYKFYPGKPRYYTINQGVISIAPATDVTGLTYTYYAKFPTLDLTNSTSSNWLTINAPRVYLGSLLIEIARASQDDNLLVKEVGNYKSAIQALISSDKAGQISGNTLRRQTNAFYGRTR